MIGTKEIKKEKRKLMGRLSQVLLTGNRTSRRPTGFRATSCSRKVGWDLCANRHKCDNAAVFFANTRKNGPVFFCEECAPWVQKCGLYLHRIV